MARFEISYRQRKFFYRGSGGTYLMVSTKMNSSSYNKFILYSNSSSYINKISYNWHDTSTTEFHIYLHNFDTGSCYTMNNLISPLKII